MLISLCDPQPSGGDDLTCLSAKHLINTVLRKAQTEARHHCTFYGRLAELKRLTAQCQLFMLQNGTLFLLLSLSRKEMKKMLNFQTLKSLGKNEYIDNKDQ